MKSIKLTLQLKSPGSYKKRL